MKTRAFTLLEVLIAIGIFVIGFVAVASMFPAAGMMQKAAVEDVVSQQAARSAKAMIQGRGLSAATDLDGYFPLPDYRVHAVNPLWLSGPVVTLKWSIGDRSSPSTTAAVLSRQYYWVPLVRRTASSIPSNASEWQVFLFCLKREDNGAYDKSAGTWANPGDANAVPGVFNTAVTVSTTDQTRFNFATAGLNDLLPTPPGDGILEEVRPGDQVLDNNGTIYSVYAADADGFNVTGMIYGSSEDGLMPTSIWYGRPGFSGSVNTSSPTRQLSIITGAVK